MKMENELDFDKYLMILQTKIDCSSGDVECMLYDRRLSMLTVRSGENTLEYGRQKLSFSNGKFIYVTAHRAMYMCIKQISFIPRNYEISHLCHNSRCIRPDHLNMEPHAINMERLRCTHSLPKKCLGHGIYPDCQFKVIICLSSSFLHV